MSAAIRVDPDEASLVPNEWDAANAETRRVMGVAIGPELAEYSPPPDKFRSARRWAQEYLSVLMDDAEAAACAAADVKCVREILSEPNDEYEGSSSFTAACRRADERARHKPRDPHLERLRGLLDDDVSLERAVAEMDAHWRRQSEARATIEALVFGLRPGTVALQEPKVRDRLAQLSQEELREVAGRLGEFKPKIARPWSSLEIEHLLRAWRDLIMADDDLDEAFEHVFGDRDFGKHGNRRKRAAEEREAQAEALPNPLANIKPWSVAEKDIPPRQFVYGGHYLRKAISATIAPGGRAKTSLMLIEAVSMAIGRDLMTGDKIEGGARRVGVLNAEEPQDELDRRVAAILKRYEVDRSELGERLFVKSIRGNPLILAAFNGRHIQFDRAAIDYLRGFIGEHGLDVWMLDPLASFHHCRENVSDDMNPLIQVALGAVAEETNSAGDIVHHTSKPRVGFDSTVDDARGSSAIINAVRIARVLNFMNSEEARRYGVPDELRRLHIKYETGKANPTAIGNRRWMLLEVLLLANGDEVICASLFVPRIAEFGLSSEQAATVANVAQGGPLRADMRADDWFGWHLAKALKIDVAKGYPNEPADIEKLKDIIKAALKAGIIKPETRDDDHRHKRDYLILAKPLPDATLMSADDIETFIDDPKLH
jgi:hypothetical protein